MVNQRMKRAASKSGAAFFLSVGLSNQGVLGALWRFQINPGNKTSRCAVLQTWPT